MNLRRSHFVFIVLAILLAGCSGADPIANPSADPSPATSADQPSPDQPSPDQPSPDQQAPASPMDEAAWMPREGLKQRTMVDGEFVERVYEQGELFFRDGRYYVVAPKGYDGPPVFADRGPGEGVLANPVSAIEIPVAPAAFEFDQRYLQPLEFDNPAFISGDMYRLLGEGEDLGIDPTPPIDAATAQAQFGSLERQWSGPVSGEMVCHYQPAEHLLAVLPGTMAGDSFRWTPTIDQGGCAVVLPKIDRLDTVSINAYDVTDDPDFFYSRSEDDGSEGDGFRDAVFESAFTDRADRTGEELTGLGDRARRWLDDPDQQILQVRDGDTLWYLEGPGVADLDSQHLVETARVLLARFSSATRVDEPAVPLSDDERSRVDELMQRRVDTRNAVLQGDQDRSALIEIYEHTDDLVSAAPNFGDGRTIRFEGTVLRAHRRSNTSMGDIFEVFACVTESVKLESESEFTAGTTGVERVRLSFDTGRVIDERLRWSGDQCDHGDSASDDGAGNSDASVDVDFTEDELRAAMTVDMSGDGAFVEQCVVDRSFSDLGFAKLVELGLTPTQTQLGAGPFTTYNDADARAIAQVSTACGATAAALWAGVADELPTEPQPLTCLTEALGEDRLIDFLVGQIQGTEVDAAPLIADAEVAIDVCR